MNAQQIQIGLKHADALLQNSRQVTHLLQRGADAGETSTDQDGRLAKLRGLIVSDFDGLMAVLPGPENGSTDLLMFRRHSLEKMSHAQLLELAAKIKGTGKSIIQFSVRDNKSELIQKIVTAVGHDRDIDDKTELAKLEKYLRGRFPDLELGADVSAVDAVVALLDRSLPANEAGKTETDRTRAD